MILNIYNHNKPISCICIFEFTAYGIADNSKIWFKTYGNLIATVFYVVFKEYPEESILVERKYTIHSCNHETIDLTFQFENAFFLKIWCQKVFFFFFIITEIS